MSSVLELAKRFPFKLAELHAHLGTSIHSATLWQIAHDLGVRLPKKDYQEFVDYILLSEDRRMSLSEYEKKIYHPLLDKLSSGTHAVEQATYQTMCGAYRNNGIGLIELRNNPMRHNRNAEIDLDHITMAMLRGMERALLEHRGLKAGLIFCMSRDFTFEQNATIVEKAMKYHKRGVVGIDVAGSAHPNFNPKQYTGLVREAKAVGLKVTVHSGETEDANDMWEVLEHMQPDRIGHGIRAAYDKPLMKELTKRKVVLEVCPMSNLVTKAVENIEELKYVLRTLIENKVAFSINTDWPEVINDGRLWQQFQMLLEKKLMSIDELTECNRVAWASSFVPKKAGLEAYL